MSNNNNTPQRIINLPKGGGSISGIGETFSPDPHTGTANLSIPITMSVGRSGLMPQLSLHYNTGFGNGLFGLGWELSPPDVSRSTEKCLPSYSNEDTFILSGRDELVHRPDLGQRREGNYIVDRFSPRIEKDFERIECWRHFDTPHDNQSSSFWVVTTSENITSVFGATSNATIKSAEDPQKVFRWQIQLTFDGKGNFIHFVYKPEDEVNVPEAYRRPNNSTFTYLKRVRYCNASPTFFTDALTIVEYLNNWKSDDCYIDVVFDYGEHRRVENKTDIIDDDVHLERQTWTCRSDPFSNGRSRFTVRTYRLCNRILTFHKFNDLKRSVLVRSTDFKYQSLRHNGVTQLKAVTQRGYKSSKTLDWKFSEDSLVRSQLYEIASIPPLEFTYSEYEFPETIDASKHLVQFRGKGDFGPFPSRGLNDKNYALIDVGGRGLADIVETTTDGYWYWSNLGNGEFSERKTIPRLGASQPAGAPPLQFSNRRVSLTDMSGDGCPDIVVFDNNTAGYYPGDRENPGWKYYKAFKGNTHFSLSDPNVRLLDLTGDGRFDALRIGIDGMRVYKSEGEDGFKKLTVDCTPPPVYFDSTNVYLIDMTGDGLADIVKVERDTISYWPNLGYGCFGAEVTLDNPVRALPAGADRMFFVDIDGSGPADLVYVENNRIRYWINQSGNSWGSERVVENTPYFTDGLSIDVLDAYGAGYSGVLWSNAGGLSQYHYLPLSHSQKSGLLVHVTNNMGLERKLSYLPSTDLALRAEEAGKPWKGRLPFPVHVLTRVEQIDSVSKTTLVSEYDYSHGHYDGIERRFNGFGRVDRYDSEILYSKVLEPQSNVELKQPTILTRTWFHIGSADKTVSQQFSDEYYSGDSHAPPLSDSEILDTTADELHDALRTLAGRVLREEVFECELSPNVQFGHPYTVSEYRYCVRCVEPRQSAKRRSFSAYQAERVHFVYDRNPDDPRLLHDLTLKVDEFNHPTETARVAYPRRRHHSIEPEQRQAYIVIQQKALASKSRVPFGYRHGSLVSELSYELTGTAVHENQLLEAVRLSELIQQARPIEFQDEPTNGIVEKRVFAKRDHFYWEDDAKTVLKLGEVGFLALPYRQYELSLSDEHFKKVFGSRINLDVLEREGGFERRGNTVWSPSAHQVFDANNFFHAKQVIDPFGHAVEIAYDTYGLLPVSTRDPLGNTVKARNDYRTLCPWEMIDPNGNRQQVAYDALGIVVATSIMGKVGTNEGDENIEDYNTWMSLAALRQQLNDPLDDPHALLQHATTRIVYDLWQNVNTEGAIDAAQPAAIYMLVRETHESDIENGEVARTQHQFSYIDGSGREVQSKSYVRKNVAASTGQPQWVSSGLKVYNNKGNVVRQYEPFFSTTHQFKTESSGVSKTFFYDGIGRVVATLHPNHTYEKVLFGAWGQTQFDVNDTVLTDPSQDLDIHKYFVAPDGRNRIPETDYLPTWYSENVKLPSGDPRREVAQKTAKHANTPTVLHQDPLGRTFLTVLNNGLDAQGNPLRVTTRVALDIKGKERRVVDANERTVIQYDYDVRGATLHQSSMDAGERWSLSDVLEQTLYAWDSRGSSRRVAYDDLRRITEVHVTENGVERLAERIVYGEAIGEKDNHRTRVFQHFDGAGVVTNEKFDFKGNPIRSTRKLLTEYKQSVDWRKSPALEPQDYSKEFTYDALNRVIQSKNPDGSVVRPSYNLRNLLDRLDVQLTGEQSYIPFVVQVDYSAKGQRNKIVYGNGAETTYSYDENTFRLSQLRTIRPAGQERIATIFVDATVVQDIHYTYDPVGNITHIEDRALEPAFYRNQRVEAVNAFTYDATYRLVESSGREFIGGTVFGQDSRDGNYRNHPFGNHNTHPNDLQAVRNYRQYYQYDLVGNFLQMRHVADNGGWTQDYVYDEALLIPDPREVGKTSNRLTRIDVGGVASSNFTYDEHGNMVSMPHLSTMIWDSEDQLKATRQQVVNGGGGTTTYYVYDAAGQRVRKVTENGNRKRVYERIYLGDCEIYREYGDANSGTSVRLERETLHVVDDKQLIALVEVQTLRNGIPTTASPVQRYQMNNHLGSSVVEMSNDASLISYEEYHPYGTTSFQAYIGAAEVSLKRYRYTGKERDEETGLYYHGARYYASWLGRWTSCDPAGLVDGLDLYTFVRCNPLVYRDPSGLQSHVGIEAEKEMNYRIPKDAPSWLIKKISDGQASEMFNRPPVKSIELNKYGIDSRARKDWASQPIDESKLELESSYSKITLHHTGSKDTPGKVEELHRGINIGEVVLRRISPLHQSYSGYGDVGYHFFIDADGVISEGRSLKFKGAHVIESQRGNIGIAFLGDYGKKELSQKQVDSAMGLIGALIAEFDIDNPKKVIKTHGEYNSEKKDELEGAQTQINDLLDYFQRYHEIIKSYYKDKYSTPPAPKGDFSIPTERTRPA